MRIVVLTYNKDGTKVLDDQDLHFEGKLSLVKFIAGKQEMVMVKITK